MEAASKLKVLEIFTRYNFDRDDAQFMSDVLNEIDNRQLEKFDLKTANLLSQKDKIELIERIDQVKMEFTERIQKTETNLLKTIYIVGLVQFLGIVGSVLAIMNYMK